MKPAARAVDARQKEFAKMFELLTRTRQAWQAWPDMIEIFALTISNTVDAQRYEQRERRYMEIIKRYDAQELVLIAQLLAELVMTLEREPFQDYLGRMFMALELGSHWHGQFFTPDSVAEIMAQITMGDWQQELDARGWFSVNDPTCGAGVTLLAAAKTIYQKRSDFQHHVLFTGQDIDQTAGLMCYVQLALTGCAGYVKIGNTLTEPMTGNALFGEQSDRMWFTPMYFSNAWHWRRVWNMMGGLCGTRNIDTEMKRDADIELHDERERVQDAGRDPAAVGQARRAKDHAGLRRGWTDRGGDIRDRDVGGNARD